MEEGRQHYNVTLGILSLAGVAFALQQTMVIPALPTLQRELDTTTTWVTWVLTVFLLVASVATPAAPCFRPILGKLDGLIVDNWSRCCSLDFVGAAGALDCEKIQRQDVSLSPRERPEDRRDRGWAELRVAAPMVDMRMLAQRQVLFTNITALVTGFAMFGSFVLVPNFVETPHDLSRPVQRLVDYGFDASATKAGLYLLPSSITLLFAGPIAGLLGRRWGSKWPLAIGLVLVAASAASLALLHDEPWQLLLAMAVIGVGIGFAFASMATLITEAVRPTETGVATGMNTVMRTVGGVVGGQVGAALLTAHTIRGTGGVPSVVGFEIAFAISAVAALVGAAVAVFVTPPRLRRRERLVVSTTEVAN
jgi:MFS family permease